MRLLASWQEACRLWREGEQVHAEDLLFDAIDNALLAQSWRQVDRLLREVSLDEAPWELVLVLLTAALPAKARLRGYKAFVSRVRRVWRRRIVADFEECFRGLL